MARSAAGRRSITTGQTMSTTESSSRPTLSHLELARAAVLAPSPDNNQPWRFVSRGDCLEFCLDPGRSLPSDVNSMYDLMGLGSAIENACLAARQIGYRPQVEYAAVPEDADPQDPRPVATLRFSPGGNPDPLFAHVEARCTCRKLYSRRAPADRSLAGLAEAAEGFPEVQLDWVTDRPRIRAFARLVAVSDRFRFEYEPFHREIFRQLRFSAEEAERTRDGLDVRAMELPPGACLVLRLLRPWRRVRTLNRLGLGRLLSLPSVLSVWKSGALGVLSIPEPGSRWFLEGGRAMQRIWLAAAGEGLALQPLGSPAIFIGQMEQLGGRNLTPAHQQLSHRLAARFRQLVPAAAGRTLLLAFRIGQAAEPSVRALRRPAEEVFRSR